VIRPAPRAALAVAGIVLFATTLRIAVGSFSPVIPEVSAEIPLAPWVVGLIGSAPPIAFAVFGIITPLLARRIRLEALAVIVALVAAVGLGARALSTDAVGLVGWTLFAFAGIGVGNVILPGLVKLYFPDAIGRLTTVYVATISVATLVPPLVAVPLADAAGWRTAIGLWAVVAGLALVPWIALLAGARRAPVAEVEVVRERVLGRLLRLPVTWALVGAMVVTSATVYTMFAWLPTLLRDHAGVDPATAGAMLAVFGGMGLPFALVMPLLVERFRAIRTAFFVAVVPGLVGVAGMLWAPAAAPWVWVVLLSLPTAVFPVVIVLFGLRTRTHTTTVALSGAVQSIGYGVAAVFPIAVGALHEITGGWEASLWLLGAVLAIGIPSGLVLAKPGSVEDQWERRHGSW
jgi:MFS transporter, CP family, cyanate transporter